MIKRFFDIVCSVFGLLVFSPVIFVLVLLIKINSNGPIFFIQKRVGQYGKIFKMIKFRSMHVDTHQIDSISIKGDKRITNIGNILRKFKLDELPELWNVFIGEMSFVGPRPDVPGYADKLIGENKNILKLKPGITGPASLKYSKEEEILALQNDPKKYNDEVIYPDKVRINLEYYHNHSLWIDIKIIFATIFRIIRF